MAKNYPKWLKIAVNCWKEQEMVGNGWKKLKVVGNGRKRLEMAGTAGNGWTWL